MVLRDTLQSQPWFQKPASLSRSFFMSFGQVKTSLSPHGIGTSFSKDRNYFVSTVESPPNSNRFETLIKFLGGDVVPICVVVAENSKDAVSNHVAMARMGISTNRSDWNESLVKSFKPTQLIERLDSMGAFYQPETFFCEYCDTLLRMSGLNYPPEDKAFSFRKLTKFLGF